MPYWPICGPRGSTKHPPLSLGIFASGEAGSAPFRSAGEVGAAMTVLPDTLATSADTSVRLSGRASRAFSSLHGASALRMRNASKRG